MCRFELASDINWSYFFTVINGEGQMLGIFFIDDLRRILPDNVPRR
jgi:hypothetical protein